MPDDDLTHAGGAVVRRQARKDFILLVRAKPAPHHWVLPKGHIERGERPEQTARREVREEAGVDADPVCYLGAIEFESPKGEHVRTGYFLMRFRREVTPHEEREICWHQVADALQMVEFSNTRDIILAAQREIERHVR
jgi:8-oxo-dGTP pyrophosphatase MutT (NUDIX family)